MASDPEAQMNAAYAEAKDDLDRLVAAQAAGIARSASIDPPLTDAELATTMTTQMLAIPHWHDPVVLASVLCVAVVELARLREAGQQ